MKRNELILRNLSLADKLAYQKKRTIPFIDVDELKSAAYLGLVQAANDFQQGNFQVFASFRIRGAILDYLRELSWGSRANRVSTCVCQEWHSITTEDVKETDLFFEKAENEIGGNGVDILKLYYINDLTLKQIGEKIGVGESRVSQLIGDYKSKLRNFWRKHEDELWSEVA